MKLNWPQSWRIVIQRKHANQRWYAKWNVSENNNTIPGIFLNSFFIRRKCKNYCCSNPRKNVIALSYSCYFPWCELVTLGTDMPQEARHYFLMILLKVLFRLKTFPIGENISVSPELFSKTFPARTFNSKGKKSLYYIYKCIHFLLTQLFSCFWTILTSEFYKNSSQIVVSDWGFKYLILSSS